MSSPGTCPEYAAEVTRFVAEVDPWELRESLDQAMKEYAPHVRALLMWGGPVTAPWVVEIFGAHIYPAMVERLVLGIAGIRTACGYESPDLGT